MEFVDSAEMCVSHCYQFMGDSVLCKSFHEKYESKRAEAFDLVVHPGLVNLQNFCFWVFSWIKHIHYCSSYTWDTVGLFLLIRHIILLWVAKNILQIVQNCKIPIEGNPTILCDAASGILFNAMTDHVIKRICGLHGLDLIENKVF